MMENAKDVLKDMLTGYGDKRIKTPSRKKIREMRKKMREEREKAAKKNDKEE